jgi:hypothetical protein
MLSALFTSVADALISYAIDKLDPAERIKSWLRLDPARLAFKKALARAYSAFARQYPEYTSSLFDQSFLSTEALPELSKLLTRNQHPDPALLAQAWGRSLGANTDFAQAATKPAAYFLERFEAELKAEPALQSIFDSRAVESLPKLEAEIQKLSAELQRGLDEALKAAQNYQLATIHIGGDVKGEGIVIGNNNQLTINKYDYSTHYYYTGDFIALNEYYIPPDGVFQRVRTDDFIGRDWLTAKVDAFLNDPNRKSGALLLIGDAGVGKTSFMAHLVKERRYLHLFAEQAPGQAMLQRAMQSLGSQLVTRYQIDPYKDRDTLNALSVFPDFLERILRLAASTLTEGEKIVIVCDALDEAGTFPDHFVFGLPKELPDGVYFILSQRPVNVKLPNFEPVIENLEAQGEDNLQDIEAYLSAVAKRPEVAGQIRSKEYSEDFFIQTLKEKSQGVWMYLHYIIKEIESGARAPLDLANLPTGLVGYYVEYWDAWRTGKRGKGEEAWDELYAPLLTTLAAAQEAIPVDWLIQWANVSAKPREVTRLLTEHWRAFITEKEKDGQKAYTPYHLSFKDFITGRVDTDKLSPTQANLVKDLAAQTVDAHKRIVSAFEKECTGEWEKLVEQDYPRLHLTAHLNAAGEYEKLRIMLTEGDEKIKWAETREQKEETYAGYLNDLSYVWDYAEREQNYALAIKCMMIESSIYSLFANIPSNLLVELAKSGIWEYTKCLALIGTKLTKENKTAHLQEIIPHLPKELLQETRNIVNSISEKEIRFKALTVIAPYFSHDEMLKILSEIVSLIIQIEIKTAINGLEGLLLAISKNHENEDDHNKLNQNLVNVLVWLFDLLFYLLDSDVASIASAKFEKPKASYTIDQLQKITNEITNKIISNSSTENYHPDILIAALPYLKNNQREKIILFLIKEEWITHVAFKYLEPYLNEKLKKELLVYIKKTLPKPGTVDNEEKNINHTEKVIYSVRLQSRVRESVKILHSLAPVLSGDLSVDGMHIAFSIPADYERVIALSGFWRSLEKDQKNRILEVVLSIAKREEFTRIIKERKISTVRNDNLTPLLFVLPYLDMQSRINIFVELKPVLKKYEKNLRLIMVTEIATLLDVDNKNQCLQELLLDAMEINDGDIRAYVLAEAASFLEDELKIMVSRVCDGYIFKSKSESIAFLSTLARFSKNETKKEILDRAYSITDTANLYLIANNYDDVYNSKALKTPYNKTQDRYGRENQALFSKNNVITLSRSKSNENRRDTLIHLRSVIPYLVDTLNKNVSQKILKTIIDTARWWP